MEGIFIKDLINEIAVYDKSIDHFIWLYHHNYLHFNGRNLYFLLKRRFRKIKPLATDLSENIKIIESPWILSLSPKSGFHWIKQHRMYFKRLFESIQPDILHIHAAYPGLAIWEEIRKSFPGIKVILTEHSSQAMDAKLKTWGYQMSILMRNMDRIIFVSNYLKNKYTYADDRISGVIPNVVTIHGPRNIQAKSFGNSLLFIGILNRKVKRLDLLIDSMSRIPGEHRPSLHVIGDGTYRNEYAYLAKKLNVHIEWHGTISNQNEKWQIIRNADFLVVPSDEETFCVAAAEALSAGIPVISTRCGGPEEFINDSNGILIPKDDSSAMAEAIVKMQAAYHRFNRQMISKNAIARFSSMSIVPQYLKLYRELCTHF